MIHIHIHIHIHTYIYICMYIYIYMYTITVQEHGCIPPISFQAPTRSLSHKVPNAGRSEASETISGRGFRDIVPDSFRHAK